jgi:LysM repeat protein
MRRRRLIVYGGGLGAAAAAVAVGAIVLYQAVIQPAVETEPPQAPASAPEPTLVAVEMAQPTADSTPASTRVPSPFAGIAEPPAQPPQRTGLVHHTVIEGEVLWQIAEQYALRPETIVWANSIQDPDLLLVGQDLIIPPADGVLYTVVSGDRVVDIVDRYGVDIQAVIGANQLTDADQIQAGVDLFLPGGRPLSATASQGIATAGGTDEQAVAGTGEVAALPDNIDALLASGWLTARGVTDLFKYADAGSSVLHQLPGGAVLERVSGATSGRIQVRDPGDGRTRQAMTGWVNAFDLDSGRAPPTRQLPLAYPADTAMDINHVFAPYRSQLDGSPFAEANCGPTAIGMALDAFGVSVAPGTLRSQALSAQHMSGNGVGTLITALAQVIDENGLTAYGLRDDSGGLDHWSLDDLRAQIQKGRPVVVQVRYRALPGRGGAYYFGDHYILVTGVVGDGFLYNDPINVDGLGWDRVISGSALGVAMNASDHQYAYTAFSVGH